ncbi:MAG: hypothetical protein M3P52_08860 [Actinomycetota bacterium]|nr:hypothetical protein [Actinomycetota bacterium]
MGGCSTESPLNVGDYEWGKDRVTLWALVGALASLPFFVWAALVAAAGVGPAALAILAAIVAAAAVGVTSMFVGYGVEWFSRLKEHNPSQITFYGWVDCALRNLGWPAIPSLDDGDWTFNLVERSSVSPKTWKVVTPGVASVDEVRTKVAPGAERAENSHNPAGVDVFHCEISSSIGNGAALGGAIGAPVGIAAGAVLCGVLGLFTFGLALLACAALLLLGAAAGGTLGQAIGGGIGAIADAANDFDRQGEAINTGCYVALTGTWVTDRSHQHNEIHDIKSYSIIDCGIHVEEGPLHFAGAVGIGRHPTGPDP